MVKVSIIITVYNGMAYLRECLDSILNQSLEEIEVICIDDASNDETINILKEYSNKTNRIKIFTNEKNCGAGSSRNRGLAIAKGEYIVFLDADDYYESDMLEQAYNRAKDYGADICIFKENSFFDDNNGKRIFEEYPYIRSVVEQIEKRGCFSPKEINNVLFNIWNGWAWDKLFRKNFIVEKNLRFQEIKTSNDAYFVHAALASAEKITFINSIYVHYRVDVSSSLSNRRDYSWECCYLYLQKLKTYLIEQNIFQIYEKSFINWSANFLYWNFWTLNENSRKNFFIAMKEYMLDEFGFSYYGQDTFNSMFDYWFIHRIYESSTYEESKIPIDAIERWKIVLQINEKKLKGIFEYLRNNNYNSAVWGVGERGKVFLESYGNIKEIRKVYDKDLKKCGQRIKEECIIEMFDTKTCEGIDFIFVMSSSYYKEIVEQVKMIKNGIKVFDIQSYLEPYLSFPVSFEECIL